MRGKVFLLFILLLFLSISSSVSASSFEIDVSAYVYKVVDGDTFDAFPVGRVRLADVNTPERGRPGYLEAKKFLNLTVYKRWVYLDVDDVNVMDRYSRLVAVVYVRWNSTHLLNVNMALLAAGLAVVYDSPNEFNPLTWSLYKYYPKGGLPEDYTPLLQAYLDLKSRYESLEKEFSSLKISYEKLKSDYELMKASIDRLKSEIDGLKFKANMMYIFLITTMVFMAATIHFARRK